MAGDTPPPPTKMSRLIPLKEAANSITLHEDTLKKWIKKGALKPIMMDGVYFFRGEDIEKVREIAAMSLSERMQKESQQLNIPHLYKLCANGEYEAVAKELGLVEQPKDVKSCYSTVNSVLKKNKQL